MATKKVYVNRRRVYVEGKELPLGYQDVEAKAAEKMLKRGVVLKSDPNQPEEKELVNNAPTAAEIVELIKNAESLEDIEKYQDDERKTVKAAFEAKLEELASNDE